MIWSLYIWFAPAGEGNHADSERDQYSEYVWQYRLGQKKQGEV